MCELKFIFDVSILCLMWNIEMLDLGILDLRKILKDEFIRM